MVQKGEISPNFKSTNLLMSEEKIEKIAGAAILPIARDSKFLKQRNFLDFANFSNLKSSFDNKKDGKKGEYSPNYKSSNLTVSADSKFLKELKKY